MKDEASIFETLRPFVAEVTGVPADEIRLDSVLMQELGAESLDLLDLCFLIEERFAIRIEADEFERQARQRMGDVPYDTDGILTAAALAELHRALPEVDPSRLVPGLHKMSLASLLTVGVFVHLVQRKLTEKEAAGAQG